MHKRSHIVSASSDHNAGGPGGGGAVVGVSTSTATTGVDVVGASASSSRVVTRGVARTLSGSSGNTTAHLRQRKAGATPGGSASKTKKLRNPLRQGGIGADLAHHYRRMSATWVIPMRVMFGLSFLHFLGIFFFVLRAMVMQSQTAAAWERIEHAREILRLKRHQEQAAAGDLSSSHHLRSVRHFDEPEQPRKRRRHGQSDDELRAGADNPRDEEDVEVDNLPSLGGDASAAAGFLRRNNKKFNTNLTALSRDDLLELFASLRPVQRNRIEREDFLVVQPLLKEWLQRLDHAMLANQHHGIRWLRPYLLPPLKEGQRELVPTKDRHVDHNEHKSEYYRVERQRVTLQKNWAWQEDWQKNYKAVAQGERLPRPALDYTRRDLYSYPPLLKDLPKLDGEYPKLAPLGDLMKAWDQDEDYPHDVHQRPIPETLLHFNFSNPAERETARKFRDANLPFKLYDVPEVDAATKLWTDEYVSQQFDDARPFWKDGMTRIPKSDGVCQESVDSFFAFFVPPQWQTMLMGLPPVRNNDWTFATWAEHARYADESRLAADQPHFYWQAGVDKDERHKPSNQHTFISRDLPSFSSPTETFFVFHPEKQKGIQCRFGERGVTAATHYDSGRNMIAMVTGAKRYILSPPKSCGNLGIFNARKSPIFRHSLLNFGHLKYLDGEDDGGTATGKGTMSKEERAWLRKAAQAPSVETVLKAGEVLYIPSFWFHYIVSIQKSAQCNVRSGIESEGSHVFGNQQDVIDCVTAKA